MRKAYDGYLSRIQIAREFDIPVYKVDYRIHCFLVRGWTTTEQIKSKKRINLALFERLSERLRKEKGRRHRMKPIPRLPELLLRFHGLPIG